MESIFNNYTGNAMLNNALMTIEALGKLNHVSEITPSLLLDQYRIQDLKEINKRLKSYTMLFSKNGPLHNDTKNGDRIYEALFKAICNKYENDGEHICDVSGLKFQTKFNEIYEEVLNELGFTNGEVNKKDTNLSRNWFPLSGTLGSDAQALPQAKFTIQIHPICLVIMQFLPLATLLYKSVALLIDSTNFEFSRVFIANNVKEIKQRIENKASDVPIENVKDISKSNYLLKALKILEDKKMDEEYSDLNLWSFSNLGTGASCSIDRVPNKLIQKLIKLRSVSKIKNEVDNILLKNGPDSRFLECLEDNKEWSHLYPNKFGSGKKIVEHSGVSVTFLEKYFAVIESEQKIEYAKYLAYLIHKYKSKSFEKYLSKTDAWNEIEYRIDLNTVLIEATRNGEWDMYHHFEILDNKMQIPFKNNFYTIHKITHFYYQKNVHSNKIPDLKNENSTVKSICDWLISLIQIDEKSNSIVNNLINAQKYNEVNYNGMMIRQHKLVFIDDILFALFEDNLKSSRYWINELLRMFFLQPSQPKIVYKRFDKPADWAIDEPTNNWLQQIQEFSNDYINYYFDKYENKETREKPLSKFKNQIATIPNDTSKYICWFGEVLENTNNFVKKNNDRMREKWSDSLLYNGQGEFSPMLSRFLFSLFSMKHFSIYI